MNKINIRMIYEETDEECTDTQKDEYDYNIELTKEQTESLQKLLQSFKLQNKKNKKWIPENGEPYYSVSGWNGIGGYSYTKGSIDDDAILINNCFKTLEEAEFRAEQIRVYNELKNFADEYNDKIDWKDSRQAKYYLFYDNVSKKLDVSFRTVCRYSGQICFSSQELAEQAIETVGEDRIKKYLFGAKE